MPTSTSRRLPRTRRRGPASLRAAGLVATVLTTSGTALAQVPLVPFDDYALRVDRDGLTQSLAWSGGLNNPQFYSVDVDGDGLLDYYAFDRAGGVHVAVGQVGGAGPLVDKSAAVRGWPEATRFVVPADFDGDGVVDLFASSFDLDPGGAQAMFVYRGRRGDDGRLAFAPVTFATRFPTLLTYRTSEDRDQLIYVAGTDVPVVRDLDGDGDLDVLAFEQSGSYIYYYENVSRPDAGVPGDRLRFELATRCYGGAYEDNLTSAIELADGPGECAGPGFGPGFKSGERGLGGGAHPGSTLTAADLDGDGDLDLLVGDVQTGRLTALYNAPAGGRTFFSSVVADWPQRPGERPVELDFLPGAFPVAPLSSPVGTAAVDFLVAANLSRGGEDLRNVWRYVGGAPGTELTLESRSYLTELAFDHGTGSHPATGQLDGRGAPELIVGNEGTYDPSAVGGLRSSLRYYRCPTTDLCREEAPEWLTRLNVALRGSESEPTVSFDPTLADMDADGDLDLLVGLSSGEIAYAENRSRGETVHFELATPSLLGGSVGIQSSPAVADLNGDGLPDLLVGERNGNLNLFLNRGSAGAPEFASPPDEEVYGQIETRLRGFGPAESRPAFGRLRGRRVLFVGTAQGRMLIYGNLPTSPGGIAVLTDTLRTHAGDLLDPVESYDPVSAQPITLLGNRRGGLVALRSPDVVSIGEPSATPVDALIVPNPSSGAARVESGATVRAVTIVDAVGRRLARITGDGPAVRLPVLPKGVYLVTVSTDAGDTTVRWLVQ